MVGPNTRIKPPHWVSRMHQEFHPEQRRPLAPKKKQSIVLRTSASIAMRNFLGTIDVLRDRMQLHLIEFEEDPEDDGECEQEGAEHDEFSTLSTGLILMRQ